MYFTFEKLAKNTGQLDGLRYRDEYPIDEFECSSIEEETVGKRPNEAVYTGKFRKGDCWTARGTYMWIRRLVDVPSEWTGKKSQDFLISVRAAAV